MTAAGVAVAVSFGAGCAVLTGALGTALLHRFPQPADATDLADADGQTGVAEGARPERATVFSGLRRASFIVPAAVVSAAAGVTAATLLPGGQLPQWLVLSTVGILAGGIDATTTWIPRHLTYLGWAAAAAAVAVSAIAAHLTSSRTNGWTETIWPALGWPAAGALIFTLTLALVWRFGGSGFGDVRLAPIIGAASGTLGLSGIFAALLAGILAVAAHKLAVTALRRRRADGIHPFGPGLVAGAYLTLILSTIFTTVFTQ